MVLFWLQSYEKVLKKITINAQKVYKVLKMQGFYHLFLLKCGVFRNNLLSSQHQNKLYSQILSLL